MPTTTNLQILPPERPVSTARSIFRRIIFGLLFLLPILLTVFVVYQIYHLLNAWVITPVTLMLMPDGLDIPHLAAVKHYLTPVISLATVLSLLYVLGYVFQTRLNRWIDYLFCHIPGISLVYKAVRDAVHAMQGPDGLKTINTVVLVPFPHDRARATGFLMGESSDARSGEALVCVYIPIALFPPSGYTLVFRREDVVLTHWDAATPWNMLLSGGLTVPNPLPFSGNPEDEQKG